MANAVCAAIIVGAIFVSVFFEFPEAKDDPFGSRYALMAVVIWFATLVREILRRNLDRGSDGE